MKVTDAAPLPVDAWSLKGVQGLAATLPDGSVVRVNAIRLDHASALEAVLLHQLFHAGWDVDLARVSNLAEVERLLTIGAEAHLPLLHDCLYDVRYLTKFRDWTWMLHTASAGVGSSRVCREDFLAVVKRLCKKARRFVSAGLTETRGPEWMVLKLHEVHVEVNRLKGSVVSFLHKPSM